MTRLNYAVACAIKYSNKDNCHNNYLMCVVVLRPIFTTAQPSKPTEAHSLHLYASGVKFRAFSTYAYWLVLRCMFNLLITLIRYKYVFVECCCKMSSRGSPPPQKKMGTTSLKIANCNCLSLILNRNLYSS